MYGKHHVELIPTHSTGFDIHQWISENVDWKNDFEPHMRSVVEKQNLESYLIW